MTDNDISYKIRGAIFNVYNFLGPGLLESVYEEALVYELKQLGLKVERQKEVPIKYKDTILNTALRLDLIVEDKVIIELKSVSALKDIHFKQTLTYLRLLELNLGILVNFNTHNILNSIHRIVA